ncbi:hypothetical protein [Aquicella lusitana]|uniref:Heme oxygenase-like protein n=1 Tax=Aquicella lusitana TaxID=254246 RepID=A0A370GTD5_9COXI|nr:hypothetical protein [Aquicella lusitana]RDI46947.1 hypothetical protein C8D86_10470 [Aquicella lusitana]VVC73837.1 hypothetical protein AQULUS_15870 [Aquicella lusitana]
MTSEGTANLALLLEKNRYHASLYQTRSPLMHLIRSEAMAEKSKREKLLDCIQIFSDYFQKTIMLRNVFCEHLKFMPIAQAHLREEFEHNLDLFRDRKQRPAPWDPLLDATSAWFAWKMLTLDNEEKTLLVHLVLETSANIFFTEAHQVMHAYGETEYFTIHAAVDSEHEQMGVTLLENLTADKYKRLIVVQQQGWDMLNTACDRIASLTCASPSMGRL